MVLERSCVRERGSERERREGARGLSAGVREREHRREGERGSEGEYGSKEVDTPQNGSAVFRCLLSVVRDVYAALRFTAWTVSVGI